MEYISLHWLDILTTILGLAYIWLEYRASIWLWFFGIVMPALDIYLYWSHGLYGDAGMACYYTVAAVYGLVVWKAHRATEAPGAPPSPPEGGQNAGKPDLQSNEAPSGAVGGASGASGAITHMPLRLYLPAMVCFMAAWGATYYILVTWTNSTVPLLDSFTNALSFVGLWALARKYIEQWWFWIVVDAVCCVLYVQKGIPFKAGLYGLYVVIAVAGYFKWKTMMNVSAHE